MRVRVDNTENKIEKNEEEVQTMEKEVVVRCRVEVSARRICGTERGRVQVTYHLVL